MGGSSVDDGAGSVAGGGALDGDGLCAVEWSSCDEVFGGALVASPADARGRGILLAVTRGGAGVDLTGAALYLVWRHRQTRERGCEPFSAVDAAAGRFSVYWPAAMAAAEGTVDAQVLVSWGERALSSRPFGVRVERDLTGGGPSGDGYSLFLEALKRYEEAAADAIGVAEELRRRADAGEFDGADGKDGVDGAPGVDGKDGAPGRDGVDGAAGPAGPAGPKGDAFSYSDFTAEQLEGLRGPRGLQGEAGPAGPQGEQGVPGVQGLKGDVGPAGPQGEPGPQGERGIQGVQGPKGDTGDVGATGPQGPKGDKGDVGPQGPAGKDGVSPDLSGYATTAYVDAKFDALQSLEGVEF